MLKLYYDITRNLGFREAVIYGFLHYKIKLLKDLPYHPVTNKKMLLRLKKAGYIKRLKFKSAVGISYTLVPPKENNYVRLKDPTKTQFLYWTLIKLQEYSQNPKFRNGKISNQELLAYTGFSKADLYKAFRELEKQHLLNRDYTLRVRTLVPLTGKDLIFEQPVTTEKHKFYNLLDYQIKPIKKEVPILKRKTASFKAVGEFWDKKISEFSAKELGNINLFDEVSFTDALASKRIKITTTTMDRTALAYYYEELISWFGKYTLQDFINSANSIINIFAEIYKNSNIKSLTWQTLIHPYNRKRFRFALKKKRAITRGKKKLDWLDPTPIVSHADEDWGW